MKWLLKPLPAALVLVLLWTLCRLVFLWHMGIPQPLMHDEFSYLLGADTFAHGRLANPAPPDGRFFESFHVLVHPTYASKYPPGQAMFLALGQVFFKAPIYGVIAGNALMLFTFCLMLFAWVPPQWALAVSGMFALVLSPTMYWTNSYWGGSVAASGGALVLLAIGIYRKRQSALAGIIFALGVLLLFWTRPFEGGVFTFLVLIVFVRDLWRKPSGSVLAATLSVIALGGAWTCYDNFAITGKPFLLPYAVYQHQYESTPVFWFLHLRAEPTDSSSRIAALLGTNGWAATTFYKLDKPGWRKFADNVVAFARRFERPLRIAVLLTLLVPAARRDPVYWKTCLVAGVFLLALGVETFQEEHYAAPVWGALALMIAVWAEHAWNLRIRKLPVGAVLVALTLVSPAINAASPDSRRLFRASSQINWSDRRTALIRRLSTLPERQLVFVRYPSPDWHVHEEWVYNSADIDHQRVVFARDLGPEEDQALLNYYPDRTVWQLAFDPVSGLEHIERYIQAASQHDLASASGVLQRRRLNP